MTDDWRSDRWPCAACGAEVIRGRRHPMVACYLRTWRLMRRNGGFFAYEERWLDALPPSQVHDRRPEHQRRRKSGRYASSDNERTMEP